MVDTVGEENERRIKEKVVLPTRGGEATNLEIWKLYMNPYVCGIRKKRTTYRSRTGRESMSTGTLLTPTHYLPTL